MSTTPANEAPLATHQPSPASRVVIVHPEMGIYLGTCMGLGFWSKLDPVGQPSAVTFANDEEAQAHMQTWDCGPPEGASCHAVIADEIDGQGPYAAHFASIQACVQAGLEGWTDAYTPVANEMPC